MLNDEVHLVDGVEHVEVGGGATNSAAVVLLRVLQHSVHRVHLFLYNCYGEAVLQLL